jgi:dihydroorotate dehydrogenase (fumarate)
MVADQVKCDLAATTGIHDGATVVKNLLAGAKAVQIASVIYEKGPDFLAAMLDEIRGWMKQHGFNSIRSFTGKLSQGKIENPQLYERSQFMKYFSSS